MGHATPEALIKDLVGLISENASEAEKKLKQLKK
jgi:hypothetical protein